MQANVPSRNAENVYPPRPVNSADPLNNRNSRPRMIVRFTRVFTFKRKHSLGLSDDQSHQTSDYGSTTSTSNTRSSSRSPARRRFKPRSKGVTHKPPPPVVVRSWRYKAVPQMFTVRVETEFTVTCTVVQPESRFHFRWPGFLKIAFCAPRRRSEAPNETGRRSTRKTGRRKSRGGVAIERDVFDDAVSISEPQPRFRPVSQITREKRTKAVRRSSGWAGVFSASECHPSTSASGSTRSSHEHENANFAIDRTSKMLVVPNVDIGVAYVVKQEVENAPETVRLVSPNTNANGSPTYATDSDDSWLEL